MVTFLYVTLELNKFLYALCAPKMCHSLELFFIFKGHKISLSHVWLKGLEI